MTSEPRQIVSRAGNRQRLRAAYEGRFTGEVPFFESYVAEEIVDQVMGRPMGTHMLKLPPADYVEFLKRTGMDAAYVAEGWFLGRKNVTDENGHVHYVDGTIKSRDDFDQIVLPSLDLVRERIESVLEVAHAANLGVSYGLDMAVSTVMTSIGPTDSLRALHDDPDFVNEFLDRAEEYTIPLAECVSQYPLDAIWMTGLKCANAGPVISPAMHEEFVLPRVEKVMRIIRPSGIPAVLHSDGDSSMFMDWIVRTGFSALHPVEPGFGRFDIYKLKETYGSKICLCGNIDVGGVLVRGTPEDVRVDTLEHIRRLAPGGGYVCGSSHDITENIPFENFAMLAQTVCSAVVPESGAAATGSVS